MTSSEQDEIMNKINSLKNLIDLINSKKKSDNEHHKERIHLLLENNRTNLEYYENKEFVLGSAHEM